MKVIPAESATHAQGIMGSAGTVLVDFYKDNCPGCTMLDKVIEQNAENLERNDIALLKVKMEVVGDQFFKDNNLRQTPSLILMRDGVEVKRHAGFMRPSDFAQWIS